MARGFTHPNLGTAATVEQRGRMVTLTFVCGNKALADGFAETLVSQLKNGALNLTLMGKPTSVKES
jgi:hypothetical protein